MKNWLHFDRIRSSLRVVELIMASRSAFEWKTASSFPSSLHTSWSSFLSPSGLVPELMGELEATEKVKISGRNLESTKKEANISH